MVAVWTRRSIASTTFLPSITPKWVSNGRQGLALHPDIANQPTTFYAHPNPHRCIKRVARGVPCRSPRTRRLDWFIICRRSGASAAGRPHPPPMGIVTASATPRPTAILSALVPASSDPSSSVPSPRQTKVVLPKKKPLKWSTGVAPGEYGGPPTTTKLRKYWGGRGDEDPVTATDDFIWNKDFLGRMQRLLREDQAGPNFLPPVQEQSSGFLSLNRAMSLDNVEIDLSKELRPPPKPVLEQQVEAARRGVSTTESLDDVSSPRWRFVPTRREEAKWDRASKAATGGSDVILRESRRERGDPKILAAQAREQYFKLKWKLQLLTLGIGGIGVVSAYISYSPEIAASYGAGLLGSLVYIRLLGNSVDSMASGAKGVVKGAIAQPRLLVPVALVMIYNRWHEILVPDYGFMHLELIPMLVGFFTYKVATFVQAIQDAVKVVEKRQV